MTTEVKEYGKNKASVCIFTDFIGNKKLMRKYEVDLLHVHCKPSFACLIFKFVLNTWIPSSTRRKHIFGVGAEFVLNA